MSAPTAEPLTADVAVDSPAPNLYTYLIPPELGIKVGQMVQAPFGGRELSGYVMSVGPPPGQGPYKNIRTILKAEPLFGPEFLGLARFVSRYYIYPIGLCVKEILPGGLTPKLQAVVELTEAGRLAPTPTLDEPLKTLKDLYPVKVPLKSFKERNRIYQLQRDGLVAIDWIIETKGLDYTYEWYLSPVTQPPEPFPRLGPKAKVLWSLIANAPPTPLSHYRRIMPDAMIKAKALVEKGLIKMEKKALTRDDPNRAVTLPTAPVINLTPDQQIALTAIEAGLEEARRDGRTRGFLLFGVTGSGKTEVYLRAAAQTLAAGRGVLWLAPEIALTLGLEGRLKEKFPEEIVSVLHSALTPGQRHDHWLRLARGESRLALGARSAVFAPVNNLGLIIVDEEHDWAYKQEDGLRYHGRDIAAWRAREQGAILILGSATPSLESYKAAEDGRLTLLRLTSRPGQSILPTVTLLDRRQESKRRPPLAPVLAENLRQTLARGEQALLFLNRRGLSSLPMCLACGKTLHCPHCSLALTLHGANEFPVDDTLADQTLVCHGCGHKAYPPKVCPVCSSPLVRYLGVGTEKLYNLVEKDFQAKALKLDADSASQRGGLKKILESFGQRQADVLVGTQMAAKGHDFPFLTLVGVVEADLGLNAPDFRAAERTFQLLSQVAGRAGRRERPGQVIIQTANPEHYALVAARDHDYEGFYREEIGYRQELGYPPFGRMALIRLAGPEEKPLENLAETAAKIARNLASRLNIPGLEIMGPAPAPVAKLRARYRFQIMVRANDHDGRRQLLDSWLPRFRKSLPEGIIMTVDVDPYSVM
ncbi:MAG: primosomal protein N' [Deltaproteobacteria bacterium]|jgi:primosomal protein N' (replication factor Y)|nr:primosomal protein N' [Deltaproteobacteria bacterium]